MSTETEPQPRARFGHVIASLRQELEHWQADRETDPDFSDAMVEEIEDAIAQLLELN